MQNIGESLADPVKYGNLFAGWSDSLAAEKSFREAQAKGGAGGVQPQPLANGHTTGTKTSIMEKMMAKLELGGGGSGGARPGGWTKKKMF